jgi:hypothetical protein
MPATRCTDTKQVGGAPWMCCQFTGESPFVENAREPRIRLPRLLGELPRGEIECFPDECWPASPKLAGRPDIAKKGTRRRSATGDIPAFSYSGMRERSVPARRWRRRGDSNPNGFPHHPLKPLPFYNSLESFCFSNGFERAKITHSVDLGRFPQASVDFGPK